MRATFFPLLVVVSLPAGQRDRLNLPRGMLLLLVGSHSPDLMNDMICMNKLWQGVQKDTLAESVIW